MAQMQWMGWDPGGGPGVGETLMKGAEFFQREKLAKGGKETDKARTTIAMMKLGYVPSAFADKRKGAGPPPPVSEEWSVGEDGTITIPDIDIEHDRASPPRVAIEKYGEFSFSPELYASLHPGKEPGIGASDVKMLGEDISRAEEKELEEAEPGKLKRWGQWLTPGGKTGEEEYPYTKEEVEERATRRREAVGKRYVSKWPSIGAELYPEKDGKVTIVKTGNVRGRVIFELSDGRTVYENGEKVEFD